MRNLSHIPFLALALLSGCASNEKPASPDPRVRAFLGEDLIAILSNAERVESYRVARDLDQPPDGKTPRLCAMNIIARGPDLNAKQRDRLLALIFDADSYGWDYGKGCEPMPGVHLRAIKGAHFVDIALCFECEMWGFGKDSSSESFPKIWEDFDPVTRALAKLAKELFPADPKIQKLMH